jgi:uncharacterized membrane protein YphA (DoxX/SURF4 family)
VRARHRPPTVQTPRAQKGAAAALVLIRISVGVYMFFVGYSKVSWLLDPSTWTHQLSQWAVDATPISRWYLDRIVPGAPIFARIIPIAEMVGGLALAFGFWTRLAAGLCLVMMLNAQIAAGAMFKYAYLADATGLPVVGALLGLILGGAKLPMSLRK